MIAVTLFAIGVFLLFVMLVVTAYQDAQVKRYVKMSEAGLMPKGWTRR